MSPGSIISEAAVCRQRAIAGCLVWLIVSLAAVAGAAPEDVIVNEITTWAPQTVEILNTGPGLEDLSGFRFEGNAGLLLVLAAGTSIAPGGIRTFELPGNPLGLTGDALGWIDDFTNPIDVVAYGNQGGAPAPVAKDPSALARTGGGANADLAANWTVTLFNTLGAPNNAQEPDLSGAEAQMNEWELSLTGPVVELFNPTSVPIFLGGYLLTNDLDFLVIPSMTVIDPLGFVTIDVFPLHPGGTHANLYLLRSDGVRLDQIGFADAPGDSTTVQSLRSAGKTLCSFPDGSGPHDGFDLPSSGAGVTRFRCDPSLGTANSPTTNIGEALLPSTWGRVKTTYDR